MKPTAVSKTAVVERLGSSSVAMRLVKWRRTAVAASKSCSLGDTAVRHSLAYCLAVKAATSCAVAMDVQIVRTVLLEVNRIYNHVTGTTSVRWATMWPSASRTHTRCESGNSCSMSSCRAPAPALITESPWSKGGATRSRIVWRSRPDGTIGRIKFVDPSFFDWPALPVALAGDTIAPDSPLTNKGFNLSYTGNEL